MTKTNFPISLNPFFHTTYSKSQIFVQKFNFYTKPTKPPTFSRVFHPNFFLTIFLVKSKLRSPNPQHLNIFTSFSDNFLRKSKLNFWTKNEDFEQCVLISLICQNILFLVVLILSLFSLQFVLYTQHSFPQYSIRLVKHSRQCS